MSFVFEPAESACVNYAVAIALKRIPVGVRQFRITASAAVFDRKTEMGERARICSCFLGPDHYFF